ncbi:MAG: tetratricopeptide repeat protein [Bacteroidales bacterium]|nr:tetratricopeptide repeat protein [Bacteroidales bacterium]MBN2634428.1 tetratricopeptide repeat protein [Bacteroidales bacterium]
MLLRCLIPEFLFLALVLTGRPHGIIPEGKQDTSYINRQNSILFADSRRNPDLVIRMGQRILRDSEKISYRKGIADASLAMGSAWLAKYFNSNDSALYYNMQAYKIYTELDDIRGKARACYYLAYVYSIKGDLNESDRYASLSLSFFQEVHDSRGAINALHVLSFLAKQRRDYKQATGLINEAIETARTTNDTVNLADVLNTLGNIYKDMALFNKAIDNYFEALRLWESTGDTTGISIAYGSISLMYYYQKDWNKALEYGFRKAELSTARGELYELSKTYNSIAQIFNGKSETDSALHYFRKALRLNEIMKYPPGFASSCNNIASTFLLIKQFDSADYYISRALKTATETNDPSLPEYWMTQGNIYKATGKLTLAEDYISEAYNMAREKNLPLIIHDASLLLSEIYSGLGRKDKAYDYLKEHQQLKDSISNDEFLKQVTRMEIQYDFDKRQEAAEYERMQEKIVDENRIRRQRSYMAGLALLVLLVSLISVLYIRHNRLRSKYAQMDLEQRLLRAQMNPHFIFNSLSAVQDLILAEKNRDANTYLVKIAKLMRNILENSRQEFISLDKEIETIKLYLDLQLLRFETEFDYALTLDSSIEPENISIPPMLIQPCVENSIEHGLLPLKEKGKLKIDFKLNNGLMRIEVTDNGIGRQEAATIKSVNRNKKSLSTQITLERLENFRKSMKQKGITYEITDLSENDKATGTRIIMMLPWKKMFA